MNEESLRVCEGGPPMVDGDLRSQIEEMKRYEWFDEGNRNAALEHIEALYYISSMGSRGQALMRYESLIDTYNRDRAQKIVDAIKRMGKDSKVFTVKTPPARGDFYVEGGEFDWRVVPLDASREMIPLVHLRTVDDLSERGLEFEGFGIATPCRVYREPLLKVAKEEALAILTMGLKAAKKMGEGLAKALEYLDPILLGRVGRYWVVIGRW
ncbi:MAG: hypothetical protein ACUVXI_13645 [bacterium]